MESNAWKAKRYDDLLAAAGDQLEQKILGFDLLSVQTAGLRWKAERYDELMRLSGERALSRLKNFDSLVAQVREHKLKQEEFLEIIEAKFPTQFIRLRVFEAKINKRLSKYENLATHATTLEAKAARYDELVELSGERIAAKLAHYDELLAQQNAKSWKIRRYDNLVSIGGERIAAKLRAYDGLIEETKRLRGDSRRMALRYGASEALSGETPGAADATPDYSIVVVLGAARSGTTMVGSYLAWAPECHDLPQEAAPLFAAMRNHAGLLAASDRFMSDENRIAADASTQAYLRLFCDAYHAQQKTPTIVFRSPALTRYFNVMQDLFTFAPTKFICCVRDPRDTCVSLLDWNARAIEKGRAPILEAPTAETAAEFYMGYYNGILALKDRVDPNRLMFVRYEDAIREAKKMASQIGQFAGVQLDGFDPAAPWPDNSYDFQKDKDTNLAVTPLYGKPPSESQIGRYQDRLTAEEIAKIEEICEPVIRAFRYDSRLADVLP